MSSDVTPRLLDELTTVVSQAAAAVLAACARALDTRAKADLSPVTAADLASEAVILEGVARLLPGVPIVSEEAVNREAPPDLGGSFILVDPLDGTRELVAGRDEYCINLAMIVGGRPALGLIAVPTLGLIWRGTDRAGAERLRLAPGSPADAASEHTPIHPRPWPDQGLVVAVSRSHLDAGTEAFLARLPVAQTRASGSAVKFCRIAEGAADLYPRLSQTCEWDVAAGHAILAAAGGAVTAPDGAPIRYGRAADSFHMQGFIALGDPAGLSRLGLRAPR